MFGNPVGLSWSKKISGKGPKVCPTLVRSPHMCIPQYYGITVGRHMTVINHKERNLVAHKMQVIFKALNMFTQGRD